MVMSGSRVVTQDKSTPAVQTAPAPATTPATVDTRIAPDPAALAAFGGESGAPIGPRTVAAYLAANGYPHTTDKTVRRIVRDSGAAIVGAQRAADMDAARERGDNTRHKYAPATAARIVAVRRASGGDGGAL
jgi:hypothetical protein